LVVGRYEAILIYLDYLTGFGKHATRGVEGLNGARKEGVVYCVLRAWVALLSIDMYVCIGMGR